MENLFERLRNCGVCLFVAFLLFKFGGWHIVWGHEFSTSEHIIMQVVHFVAPTSVMTDGSQSFIANKDGVLVRINEKYYGVNKNTQYFDSPLIQWGMLFLCLVATGVGIKALFDDY